MVRLLLRPAQTFSTSTTIGIVWIMAILGIIYQILYHERYKFLETCIYIIVGLFPAIVIIDMVCFYNRKLFRSRFILLRLIMMGYGQWHLVV